MTTTIKRANIRICKVCHATLIDEEAYSHIMKFHRDAVVRAARTYSDDNKTTDSYS